MSDKKTASSSISDNGAAVKPVEGAGENNPRTDELKAAGRSTADELQNQFAEDGDSPFAWFDALYARAEGARGFIPWSEAAPRFKLIEWLKEQDATGNGLAGLRAVDVGCGLGDNARCLKAAGLDVLGFDISSHAVEWAARNFGDLGIRFEVADILHLPTKWHGRFDIVHETYNLQAMPTEYVEPAIHAIASLVAPGGRLLVMTRGRLDHEEVLRPPRPLTLDQLKGFERAGLCQVKLEEFFSEGENPIRHYLAEYKHAAD